jgi:hypothetical protein
LSIKRKLPFPASWALAKQPRTPAPPRKGELARAALQFIAAAAVALWVVASGGPALVTAQLKASAPSPALAASVPQAGPPLSEVAAVPWALAAAALVAMCVLRAKRAWATLSGPPTTPASALTALRTPSLAARPYAAVTANGGDDDLAPRRRVPCPYAAVRAAAAAAHQVAACLTACYGVAAGVLMSARPTSGLCWLSQLPASAVEMYTAEAGLEHALAACGSPLATLTLLWLPLGLCVYWAVVLALEAASAHAAARAAAADRAAFAVATARGCGRPAGMDTDIGDDAGVADITADAGSGASGSEHASDAHVHQARLAVHAWLRECERTWTGRRAAALATLARALVSAAVVAAVAAAAWPDPSAAAGTTMSAASMVSAARRQVWWALMDAPLTWLAGFTVAMLAQLLQDA